MMLGAGPGGGCERSRIRLAWATTTGTGLHHSATGKAGPKDPPLEEATCDRKLNGSSYRKPNLKI